MPCPTATTRTKVSGEAGRQFRSEFAIQDSRAAGCSSAGADVSSPLFATASSATHRATGTPTVPTTRATVRAADRGRTRRRGCSTRRYDATAGTDRLIVERVAEVAATRGTSRVHIALAWLLQKEAVTAPIIGATKLSHLEDAVGALAVKLSPEEIAYLEEPYVPHPVVGAQ